MFHFPAYPPHKTLRCRPTTAGGLPHSDTLGSKPCRRLPEAYRGPTRPSSVLPAKASTIRPWQQTHQPPQKGPTGPCHLHWNTLRQLIRSSKTPPTPTRAWTAYQNTREHNPRTHPTGGHGTVRQNQQYEHTRHTPQGTPFMLASTLQFSNHHTTPPQAPTPHKGHGQDGGNGTPPPTRGLAVREPNSMHHTTVHPHHKGAGALTFSQPARDATRPGSRERKHPHIGALPCAHKTP